MRRLLACGVALAVAMCVPAWAAHGGGGHGMSGHGMGGHGMGGHGMGMRGGPSSFGGHRGPGFRGSFHRHSGSRFFFGFGFPFVVDPFFYYPYAYPYPYYAPYGYEYPPPPPPEEPGYEAGQEPQYGAQSEAPPEESQPTPEDAERASYGLVQLRGVPDGASVDLDGRFWMKAERLENRWVALPRGPHTITVHVEGREPAEQQVDVEPGKTRVVRFTLGRHRA